MVEAIDAGDDAHFKEELGDLLLAGGHACADRGGGGAVRPGGYRGGGGGEAGAAASACLWGDRGWGTARRC